MTKRIAMVTAWLVLASAAAAQADDVPGRVRTWAIGWESGLTLRKGFGLWDVSLSAGPSDWLSREDSYRWSTDLPDSVQGSLDREYDHSRESGFVRVAAARELTRWRTLSLHGGLGAGYLWSNEWTTNDSYDLAGAIDHRTRTEHHYDRFSTDLHVRMVWRPAPIVSVQLRAGLTVASIHGVRTYESVSPPTMGGRGDEEPYHELTFSDYGPYGTGNLEFFFWF